MAPFIDQDTGRTTDADTLAAMAEPLRDRIIEERIAREEDRSLLLFDDPDIFDEIDAVS